MASGVKYPQELKDRAVRLVREAIEAEPELQRQEAIKRISNRLGMPVGTLRSWYYQNDDPGVRIPKVALSDEARKIKALEREVRELRRSNEILLAASSFFARELDPRLPF